MIYQEVPDQKEIEELLKEIYKWQENVGLTDNEMITDVQDSLYVGVDLVQLEDELNQLKATNFFSGSFVKNYADIFRRIDSKLKNKEIEWFVGDLSPFGNGSNSWSNCQDYLENYWENIVINHISYDQNTASFKLSWDKSSAYEAKAVKEHGR